MGFKVGPQVTSFTNYHLDNADVAVQSRMRFVAGLATKFVYAVPRIEVDVFWNARGWVNTENTVNFVAFPVILKFPVELDRNVELEVGPGVEPELTLFGADPHKGVMLGGLISAGLSVDFRTFVFDFDLRYNIGVNSVSDYYAGSKNRDLQAIAGFLWHF